MQLAALTCALVAAVLAIAALTRDPRHPVRVVAAALVALMATFWGLWRLRANGESATEIGIRDGSVWLRQAKAGLETREEKARCVFAASWLITFRFGSNYIRLWPDSLPPDAFRRVHACVRWERTGITDATRPHGRQHPPE